MIDSRKRRKVRSTEIIERKVWKIAGKRYDIHKAKPATIAEIRQALGISKRDVEEVKAILAEVVGH